MRRAHSADVRRAKNRARRTSAFDACGAAVWAAPLTLSSDAIASAERLFALARVADIASALAFALTFIALRFESASFRVHLTLEHLFAVRITGRVAAADRVATLRGRASTRAATVSTLSSDRRHVRAIATHSLATFAARDPRLVRREFVSRPFGMSCSSAFARNLTLLRCVH